MTQVVPPATPPQPRGAVPAPRTGRALGFLGVVVVLVGFLVAVIGADIVGLDLTEPVGDVGAGEAAARLLLSAAVALGVTVGVVALASRLFERRDWRDTAALRDPSGGRHLLAGLGAGTAAFGLIVVGGLSAGLVEVRGVEWEASGVASTLAFVAAGALATAAPAWGEEVTFRGYMLTALGGRMRLWLATLVAGVLFALPHLVGREPEELTGWYFATLAGFVVAFSLMRWATGSVWFPAGFHVAWNVVQYNVIGFGHFGSADYGHALVHVEESGAGVWLGTGASVEGGILPLTVVALTIALTVAALRHGRPRVRP